MIWPIGASPEMGSELVVMDMILKMQNVLRGFIIITGNKPMCDSQDALVHFSSAVTVWMKSQRGWEDWNVRGSTFDFWLKPVKPEASAELWEIPSFHHLFFLQNSLNGSSGRDKSINTTLECCIYRDMKHGIPRSHSLTAEQIQQTFPSSQDSFASFLPLSLSLSSPFFFLFLSIPVWYGYSSTPACICHVWGWKDEVEKKEMHTYTKRYVKKTCSPVY